MTDWNKTMQEATDEHERKQKERSPVERLVSCRAERDDLVRKLWLVLNEISHLVNINDFTQEDLDLWGKITEHSGCQSRLGN